MKTLLTIALLCVTSVSLAAKHPKMPEPTHCLSPAFECATKDAYICCDSESEDCTICGLGDGYPCCVKKIK